MRFQVPQFIEVEDKIFGPLTFKQFVYLAGGGGVAFVLYKILPTFLAFLIGIPVIALGVALAFYKINNKPFISIVESATKYFIKDKLYVWKKVEQKQKAQKVVEKNVADQLQIPRLSDSKLKDIAWSLGVKDSVYASEVENNQNNNG